MAEETITISEEVVVEDKGFSTDGLSSQEVDMAKEHGLVIEPKEEDDKSGDEKESDKEEDKPEGDDDGEHKEQPEVESEDNKDEVKPTYEDVEKDENNLKKYNKNEQALYWRSKNDRRKKQKAVRDLEEFKAASELNQVRNSANGNKLKKITEALGGDVTVEQLQAIIGDMAEKKDTDPMTKADYQQMQAESSAEAKRNNSLQADKVYRISSAEEIGKSKYDNFTQLTTLAQEVVTNDVSGAYSGVLEDAFFNKEIDEEQLVERVVAIAKLNPKYGKSEPSVEKEVKNDDVTRAINNSKKKVSSASMGSKGGNRTVNYNELTIEDAAKLTTTQWQKLPDKVRDRLLGKT